MGVAIKTRLVKIGNSQGVRLPKALIEQAGLGPNVTLEAGEGQITIRTDRLPREGWTEQLRLMAERGDDRVWDDQTPCLTSFDEEEWEWPEEHQA